MGLCDIPAWIQAVVAALAFVAALFVPAFIEARKSLNAAIGAQHVVFVVHRVTSYVVQAAIDGRPPVKFTEEQIAACGRPLERQPTDSLPSDLYDHVIGVAHHWECAKALLKEPKKYTDDELSRLFQQASGHATAIDLYLLRRGAAFNASGYARSPDAWMVVRRLYHRLIQAEPIPYRPDRVGDDLSRF